MPRVPPLPRSPSRHPPPQPSRRGDPGRFAQSQSFGPWRHPASGFPHGLPLPRLMEVPLKPSEPSGIGIGRCTLILPPASTAFGAHPTLGPAEILKASAGSAGPRAGEAPVGLHHLRAVPGGLVTKLPAELGQGRLGRSPAPRPRPRDPLLAQPAGGIQPFPHDPAVG